MGTGENGSANQTCAEAAIKALPATTRIKSYAKAPARTWASVPAPGRANAGRIASAMVVIGGGVYPRRGGEATRNCPRWTSSGRDVDASRPMVERRRWSQEFGRRAREPAWKRRW